MRDELERRGIQTHAIASGSLDALRELLSKNMRNFTLRDGDAGNSANGSDHITLQHSNSSSIDNQGGPGNDITSQNPNATNSVDYVELEKQLRAQVEAKRRYIELVEEMRRMNENINQNQPVQCAAVPPGIYQNQPIMRIRSEDLENVVEIFTGDDSYSVSSFVRDFEAGARRFGLAEDEMGVIAKRFLRGTAKTLMRTLRVDTWQDIRRELQNEFGQMVTSTSIHRKLAQRRKSPNETVIQYSVAMKEIAAQGNLDEVDIIGYIVDGVARDKKERFFLPGARNFIELRDLLNRYQDTMASCPRVATNITPVGERSFGGSGSGRVMATDTSTRKPPPKCFNCNEVGHYAAGCGKPKRPPNSCFKCGSIDHHVGQCKIGLHTNTLKKEIANIDTAIVDDYEFIESVSLILCNNGSKYVSKFNARLDTASPISFI